MLLPQKVRRVVVPFMRRLTTFVSSDVFNTTSAIVPSGFFAAVTSRSGEYVELAMRTAPGLIYFEKWAIAWNIGFTSIVSFVPSQMIGAPQKLSTDVYKRQLQNYVYAKLSPWAVVSIRESIDFDVFAIYCDGIFIGCYGISQSIFSLRRVIF